MRAHATVLALLPALGAAQLPGFISQAGGFVQGVTSAVGGAVSDASVAVTAATAAAGSAASLAPSALSSIGAAATSLEGVYSTSLDAFITSVIDQPAFTSAALEVGSAFSALTTDPVVASALAAATITNGGDIGAFIVGGTETPTWLTRLPPGAVSYFGAVHTGAGEIISQGTAAIASVSAQASPSTKNAAQGRGDEIGTLGLWVLGAVAGLAGIGIL